MNKHDTEVMKTHLKKYFSKELKILNGFDQAFYDDENPVEDSLFSPVEAHRLYTELKLMIGEEIIYSFLLDSQKPFHQDD